MEGGRRRDPRDIKRKQKQNKLKQNFIANDPRPKVQRCVTFVLQGYL